MHYCHLLHFPLDETHLDAVRGLILLRDFKEWKTGKIFNRKNGDSDEGNLEKVWLFTFLVCPEIISEKMEIDF